MALIRDWYPTANKSSGGAKRLIVIHTTEGWGTSPTGMYDCAIYFQGPVGASSQVCIDNYHPGRIAECVSRGYGAWTQCNYNSVAVAAEQCGYASWSRDTWLGQKEPLLRNTAQWIAEESQALGIPITDLTASQAQGSGRGVCYHSELGSAGCGHGDPGGGYPLDVVLGWAREYAGGTTPPPQQPPTEVPDMTPAVAIDSQGRAHSACIGKDDNHIYYKSPTDDDFHVVDPGSNAYSGVSFDIGPQDQGAIGYTNQGRAVCIYHKKVNTNDPWVWQAIGGQAK